MVGFLSQGDLALLLARPAGSTSFRKFVTTCLDNADGVSDTDIKALIGYPSRHLGYVAHMSFSNLSAIFSARLASARKATTSMLLVGQLTATLSKDRIQMPS
jgi:hypothetical protein